MALKLKQLKTESVISASLKLSSGEEDSSIDLTIFEPGFVKFLSPDRFDLTAAIGSRQLTFQAQVESYDLNTGIARLVGNSAAWQFNQLRQYRVWQEKPVGIVLRQLGVEPDSSVPPSVLDTITDLVQNNTTDYRFAFGVCSGLGLRLSGSLDGDSKLKASFDEPTAEPILEIGYVWQNSGILTSTSEPEIRVTSIGFSQTDSQESAKETPGNQPKVKSETADTQTNTQPKFQRIDPATGQRYTAKDDIAPTSPATEADAKSRELKWSVSLVISGVQLEKFLAQPGDIIHLNLSDGTGSATSIGGIVDSASYSFYPEHTELSLELNQPS